MLLRQGSALRSRFLHCVNMATNGRRYNNEGALVFVLKRLFCVLYLFYDVGECIVLPFFALCKYGDQWWPLQ